MPHGDVITFVAHGVGLISHEAPRFTDSGPIPMRRRIATARSRPAWCSRSRPSSGSEGWGFIKLEDTLAVTEAEGSATGEHREWMVAG